ncbi:MAG: dihydrolipoamide acetyltransferase, partial [Verrucomicrobia bacterium 21-51-4]
MAEIIEMPKMSDTMTVGTLVRWLKSEGDVVKAGDMLAEVETDKATMEVENFVAGTLLKHYMKAGSQVPVGAPMCAIGKAGEAAPKVEAPAPAKTAEAPKATAPTPSKVAAPALSTAKQPAPVAVAAPIPAALDSRLKASPLARKVAAELGVGLQNIPGSGPAGRIVRADVLAAKNNPVARNHSSPAVAAAVLEQASIPVSNLRATIARRLVESKSQVPHFYLSIEVDAAPLDALRHAFNNRYADLPIEQGGGKLTVNDLILKATAMALARVPAVNASWMGETIERHGSIDLAFGVAIEDGLVTPVIRNAEQKGLREISAEAKALAAKARSKKLTPNEMTGSTFTVTNLGMFGISNFFGIINPPNAGILSVGAALKKPVVNAEGQIVVGQRMEIGFSGDHRVVDGALAAMFLSELKTFI